jgi:hypothetical protein
MVVGVYLFSNSSQQEKHEAQKLTKEQEKENQRRKHEVGVEGLKLRTAK